MRCGLADIRRSAIIALGSALERAPGSGRPRRPPSPQGGPDCTCLFWVASHTGDSSPCWKGADYHDLSREFHHVYENELDYNWSELPGRPW